MLRRAARRAVGGAGGALRGDPRLLSGCERSWLRSAAGGRGWFELGGEDLASTTSLVSSGTSLGTSSARRSAAGWGRQRKQASTTSRPGAIGGAAAGRRAGNAAHARVVGAGRRAVRLHSHRCGSAARAAAPPAPSQGPTTLAGLQPAAYAAQGEVGRSWAAATRLCAARTLRCAAPALLSSVATPRKRASGCRVCLPLTHAPALLMQPLTLASLANAASRYGNGFQSASVKVTRGRGTNSPLAWGFILEH